MVLTKLGLHYTSHGPFYQFDVRVRQRVWKHENDGLDVGEETHPAINRIILDIQQGLADLNPLSPWKMVALI